jgi:hypothetical protein
MNKQVLLVLPCLAVFVWVDGQSIGNQTAPGYQTAGNRSPLQKCPKGKRWDYRQAACVSN